MRIIKLTKAVDNYHQNGLFFFDKIPFWKNLESSQVNTGIEVFFLINLIKEEGGKLKDTAFINF